jgi:hypothetical protein
MTKATNPLGPRFSLQIDNTTLAEDLTHATEPGRAAIVAMIDSVISPTPKTQPAAQS